jgi:uncharacterized membrane protein YeaQ/YmgE (transglycosylase-associated protein family)
MDAQALIIWLIVGAIAGWLAGMVVKGGGYGLIGDIIVGIVGALIAGWLLPQIGIVIGGGIIAAIINAFIGAVILLIILRLVRRAALVQEFTDRAGRLRGSEDGRRHRTKPRTQAVPGNRRR